MWLTSICVLVLVMLSHMRTAWTDLQQSRGTSRYSQAVMADVMEAEANQRGYIITGDANFLGGYGRNRQWLEADLHALRQTAGGRCAARVREVVPLVDAVSAEMEAAISAKSSRGYAAAAEIVAKSAKRGSAGQIREILTHVQRCQDEEAEKSKSLVLWNVSLIRIILVVGLAGEMGVLGYGVYRHYRGLFTFDPPFTVNWPR